MGRRIWIGLAVSLTSMVSWPQRARACSCIGGEAIRTMLPASGTANFPVDGKVRIFLVGFDPGVRARLGEEYRLRDAKGALVPLEAQLDGTMLTLTPAPLRPQTRYTVERVFAYTEKGERLSDSERWMLAELGRRRRSWRAPAKPTEVTRRWYADGWFVTGAGPEARRPEAPIVEEAKVEIRENGADCGPGTDVFLRYRMGAGVTATDVWAIERQAQGPISHFVPSWVAARKDGSRRTYVGNTLCNSDHPRIDVGESYAFRLVAMSAAGVRTPGAWVRATVEGTPFPEAAAGTRRGGLVIPRQDPEVPLQRWFSPPATDGSPATRRGPEACPWGFEVGPRQALASPSRAFHGMRPPLSLGWHAGDTHLAFAGHGRQGVFLRWPERATAPFEVPGPLDELRALFVSDGPLFAVTGYGEGLGAQVRLSRAGFDGQLIWKAVPWQTGPYRHPFLAAGRNVLVCWGNATLTRDLRNDLICAVADGKSGEAIRAPGLVPRRPRSAELVSAGWEQNAALAVEGGFLIAWTTPRHFPYQRDKGKVAPRTYVTRLDEKGNTVATHDVPGDGGGSFDLARVGRSVALVRAGAEGIDLTWLDLRGKPRGAPASISAGTGSESDDPRVAGRSDLAAVVWEGGAHTYAVAAVEGSAHSVAAPLDPGVGRVAPTVAAADQGFVVAYIDYEERVPYLERLACRASPPEGAPAQVVINPTP